MLRMKYIAVSYQHIDSLTVLRDVYCLWKIFETFSVIHLCQLKKRRTTKSVPSSEKWPIRNMLPTVLYRRRWSSLQYRPIRKWGAYEQLKTMHVTDWLDDDDAKEAQELDKSHGVLVPLTQLNEGFRITTGAIFIATFGQYRCSEHFWKL